MKGLVVKKSLIGKQDLLLGRQSEIQQRGHSLHNIEGIQMIYPVRTLEDLRQVNPHEYETAFLFGENTLDVIDPEFGGLDANINELYYFDFLNNEPEKLPNIVKSSVKDFGRWVLSRLGEKRLYRIAVPIIDEVVNSKTDEIVKGLNDKIQEAVSNEAESLKAFSARQGLYFKHDVVYKNGDTTTTFIKTPKGVQHRKFMLTGATEEGTLDSPLNGIPEKVGDAEIFPLSSSVDSKWTPIAPYNYSQKTIKFIPGTEHLVLFTSEQNPKGHLKIELSDSTGIQASFELHFYGVGIKEFKIKNVVYGDVIKNKGITPQVGNIMKASQSLLYLPTFAIACGDTIGIHAPTFEIISSVNVDWSHCSIEPTLKQNNSVPTKIYAIREGGGSTIPNLGELSYFHIDARTNPNRLAFKQFMLGKVIWNASTTLDAEAYHQHADILNLCSNLKFDVSDAFLRNTGHYSGQQSKLLTPQLPNIKGGWDGERYNGGKPGQATVRYAWRDDEDLPGGNFAQDYWGAFKRGRIKSTVDLYPNSTDYRACYGFQFDASLANSVYSDLGDTRPKSLVSILTVQAF